METFQVIILCCLIVIILGILGLTFGDQLQQICDDTIGREKPIIVSIVLLFAVLIYDKIWLKIYKNERLNMIAKHAAVSIFIVAVIITVAVLLTLEPIRSIIFYCIIIAFLLYLIIPFLIQYIKSYIKKDAFIITKYPFMYGYYITMIHAKTIAKWMKKKCPKDENICIYTRNYLINEFKKINKRLIKGKIYIIETHNSIYEMLKRKKYPVFNVEKYKKRDKYKIMFSNLYNCDKKCEKYDTCSLNPEKINCTHYVIEFKMWKN